MPTPAQHLDTSIQAVEFVENALRLGFSPPHRPGISAVSEAAKLAVEAGCCSSKAAFYSRVTRAKELHNLEPDWTIYRPRQYLHRPPGAPVIPFQDHVKEPMPEGSPIKVGVIGDAHDSPHLNDKSRFYWLGCYMRENKVDRVVSVGDWLTLDCFSSHTDRATFAGLAKPTFQQDLESFHESQREFQRGLGGHKLKKDITYGNHEHRAWTWDNYHPEAEPHGLKIDEAFAQWGWRTTPYRQSRFLGGVGFTHVPVNDLGKPMGGVTGGQRSANGAMFDIIHGDTHKSQISVASKLGPVRSPTVFNAATALPNGYIEGFASPNGSTWRSGVCLTTIWGGHARSWSFTEMSLLEYMYGSVKA
jgi:hypothetical protein